LPYWGDILKEVARSTEQRASLNLGPDLDGIRLKYTKKLYQLTGRAVIVYASGWLQGVGRQETGYSVQGSDVHAFMEVCHGVEERQLDLILHSPGGSPEAAEQIVQYLRTQFDDLRAIIPLQAKSAATMIALGCDEIWMGPYSELGPIDPQILVSVPEGQRFAPAHAILRDFERAKRETSADISALPAWTPILRSYAGGLIEFCTQQIQLSQEIVAGWLSKYMLGHSDVEVDERDRPALAEEIAGYFGSEAAYDRSRTHGRPLRIEELEAIAGLRVRRLDEEKDLQDAVLSIYHALDITLNGPTVKLVENHLGNRKVLSRQQVLVQGAPPATPTAPSPKPATAPINRQQRRKQERGR
jgi:hypothetical protein